MISEFAAYGMFYALVKKVGVMMNVAIPLFGTRISPRFDSCEEILIVTIEGGTILDKKTVSISSLTSHQRIAELNNRKVSALICGGINSMVHDYLKENGISVIHNVMGEADEALKRYLAGRLKPRAFCERRQRRGCRGRNGPPWRLFPPGMEGIGSKREEEKE
jgi:predicted Fe-Mo cluster-binding NifX family protein